MVVKDSLSLHSTMAKKSVDEVPEIYLGEWLKHFGIGPTEAAKIAGCSQSYISNIIAGRKPNINALYLLKLSDHMEVNVNDFFRPLPSQSQLKTLGQLSSKGQAAILTRQKKQA